jgi:hypothetical protein
MLIRDAESGEPIDYAKIDTTKSGRQDLTPFTGLDVEREYALELEHPALTIIAEYDLVTGPPSETARRRMAPIPIWDKTRNEEVAANAWEVISKAVTEELHQSKTEILLPKDFYGEDLKRLKDDINAKSGKREPILEITRYDPEAIDSVPPLREGYKRMIVVPSTGRAKDFFSALASKDGKKFADTRMICVNAGDLRSAFESKFDMVWQARTLALAVLGRLVEKEDLKSDEKAPYARALLKEMLKHDAAALGNEKTPDTFIDELATWNDFSAKTLEMKMPYFFNRAISLVQKKGQELVLMKNFWIAA